MKTICVGPEPKILNRLVHLKQKKLRCVCQIFVFYLAMWNIFPITVTKTLAILSYRSTTWKRCIVHFTKNSPRDLFPLTYLQDELPLCSVEATLRQTAWDRLIERQQRRLGLIMRRASYGSLKKSAATASWRRGAGDFIFGTEATAWTSDSFSWLASCTLLGPVPCIQWPVSGKASVTRACGGGKPGLEPMFFARSGNREPFNFENSVVSCSFSNELELIVEQSSLEICDGALGSDGPEELKM